MRPLPFEPAGPSSCQCHGARSRRYRPSLRLGMPRRRPSRPSVTACRPSMAAGPSALAGQGPPAHHRAACRGEARPGTPPVGGWSEPRLGRSALARPAGSPGTSGSTYPGRRVRVRRPSPVSPRTSLSSSVLHLSGWAERALLRAWAWAPGRQGSLHFEPVEPAVAQQAELESRHVHSLSKSPAYLAPGLYDLTRTTDVRSGVRVSAHVPLVRIDCQWLQHVAAKA